jgi:AmmeMemoRadiSam system protein B/AmmeMemoRadiSam system protein A
MAGGITVKRAYQLALPLVALLLGAAAAQGNGSAMDQTVRKPAVADQFYTADPAALKREVTGYLDAAKPPAVAGDVVAIVAPHAGYMYSGAVAAYGYRLVRGAHYDDVVVIAPSHVEYFGFASVFPGTAYETPLGMIPVDTELVKAIASKNPLVRADMTGHRVAAFERSEHALEVQLPFLQVALGSFKLVPIVMGDQSQATVEALGNVLGDALKGRRALIVASSDLSHFYPDKEARVLDGEFQRALSTCDPNKLFSALSKKSCEACGGGPVVAAMIAAKKLGADRCQVLHYANSGDVTGDRSSVVGYASAVMLREEKSGGSRASVKGTPNPEKEDPPAETPRKSKAQGASDLTKEDKIYLLRLARSVIQAVTSGETYHAPPAPSEIIKEPRGAFVTLNENGQLRGCIGYIEAIKALGTTVEEMAEAAALNDWRFPPVRAEEVPKLHIEISVLSPVFTITDPSTIVVGTYGLIITRGNNRGLLLPQVATDWGWDRETFLDQTCVKAGLPEGCWRQKGTRIEGFTAEVFSESELGVR